MSGRRPNRIDRPGTAEQSWASWLDLRHLPAADPLAWASAVVVAAHPDDEVLGVGGTMAMLAAAGARLRLIAVTDGEASHPDTDPAVLRRVRTAETAAALQSLGAGSADVIRLRFPDTGLAAREGELAAVLREQCAGFEVCLAPWERDAHADHEAAGRAARRGGLPVLSYPIWMWHWAIPADARVPWRRACQVPLPPPVVARKRSAIAAFTSQLTDRGPDLGPVIPAGVVAHFTRPQEVLLS
ncbi:MAG TPA: PIG-L family deacetylase [Streptosporangiaceae bacterium]|nr:PIG-L family deacetylase [Streptosporangiaceae bacterium]HME65814.1 PIG-L family deacetylase [Streptosporangiaceae bacterium]